VQSGGNLLYVLAHAEDAAFVSSLAVALSNMGFATFSRPLTSGPGGILNEDALAALEAARGVIFFFSMRAAEDVEIERHLVVAGQLRKPLIGVRLEDAAVPPPIKALGANWTDWYGPEATARIAINHLAPPSHELVPVPAPETPAPEKPAPKSDLMGLLVIFFAVAALGAGINLYRSFTGAENRQATDPHTAVPGLPLNATTSKGNSLSGTGMGLNTTQRAATDPLLELGTPPIATPQASGPGGRAALRLSPGSRHWSFRSRIQDAYAQGPNFGANDTLVLWGCGSGCRAGVVIDGSTGAVHDLPVGGEEYPYLQIDAARGSNVMLAAWELDGMCISESHRWVQGRFQRVSPPQSITGSCPLLN
jgi:hypothetical protein